MVIERAPLEDELGDVLEKAMRLAGCDEAALAARTGLDVARIRDAFVATPAAGYAACMSALRDVDLREAIRGVKVPVLVVR